MRSAAESPKERPIIMSSESVRAILDGRKTQTRRICKGQRELSCIHDFQLDRCPYGRPGDRLWVREAWRKDEYVQDETIHRAGGPEEAADCVKWRSPIYLPRDRSRITLEISDVRVQLVQEISDDDCIAEGVTGGAEHNIGRRAYSTLWDAINGAGSWAANPWVWAITFRRVERDRRRVAGRSAKPVMRKIGK